MSPAVPPSISVVVNTLDRATMLERCLSAFDWIDYSGAFEVVVVAGPSADGTEAVLDRFADRIRVVRCSEPNLSVSRNLGLTAARGAIVAFIDDDAVPEMEWLSDLAEVYSSADVGAAGGFVYDHTGRDFQYRYGIVDRLARASQAASPPELYGFPDSFAFPHLLGTNSSVRRDAALALGGFDTEYEYFLDETDMLVRLLDSGWTIRQVEGAYVHHKFAPSTIRSTNRVARNRRSLLKNHTYFVSRHATRHLTAGEIESDVSHYAEAQRVEMVNAVDDGLLELADLEAFDAYAAEAVSIGRQNARRKTRPAALTPDATPIVGHPAADVSRRRVVIVAAAASPDAATEALAVSREVAAAGDTALVIAATQARSHVDFAAGVWEHRLERSPATEEPWKALADAELDLIRSRRPVHDVLRP